jgi:hypothetical protein
MAKTPRLFDRQAVLDGLADAWKETYFITRTDETEPRWLQSWHEETYHQMVAANGDETLLRAILGETSSWFVNTHCHQCDQNNVPLVIVGEQSDSIYSYTARLCETCLLASISLLTQKGGAD